MRFRLLLLSVATAFGQIHVDPVLARMIPPGTVSLVGVRMDQIRNTPLYQKMIAEQKLPDLDRFVKETGFDPRHDVRELLLASNGTEGQSVLVARGSFGRITNFASLKTFKHDIYAIHGDDNAGFCLLDDSTAAAGPLPGLYAALDHWHSGAAPATPSLLKRMEQMSANAQLFAVSEGGFNIPGGITLRQGSTDFAQIFRNVEQVAFSADLRTGLDALLEADVKNEEDAKNLGDAARGLIGFARLSVPENHRELLKLWDGFHVDQHARHITLTAKVPQDLIDQLVSLIQSGEIGPGRQSHPANPR
jgi:hypothetical protein